jgi:hypothetical protein
VHRRQPRVERDQEIEALFLAHLADGDARRPHAQGLLQQAPQLDLASAFQVGLTALHRDDVGQRDLQLAQALIA